MGMDLTSDFMGDDRETGVSSTGQRAASGSSSASTASQSAQDKRDSDSKKSSRGSAVSHSLAQTSKQLSDIADRDGSNVRQENDTPRYFNVPSFKRGGVMRKTGPARLHQGEHAVAHRSDTTASKARAVGGKKRGKKRGKKVRSGRE